MSLGQSETIAKPSCSKLLIANRGEIAIRIARTAADMGIPTVAVYSSDDENNLHTKICDQAFLLPGIGVKAYLNIESIIAIAKESGADSVHPGYGFLAENSEFVKQLEQAGLTFVGPSSTTIRLLGDKVAAKQKAIVLGVPVIHGTTSSTSLAEAKEFYKTLAPNSAMLIKAVAGGGGRGMRVVSSADEIENSWHRCRSEALAAFGNDEVYVEQFLPTARHIEIQIFGDGGSPCLHFGERECTLQRRYQKLIEVAPSPTINAETRERLTNYALALANSEKYRSLGTFEFLINAENENEIFFIEANPRIQVEHTVTEQVYDVDLVRLQLEIAKGRTFTELNLNQDSIGSAKGFAIQSRINMETVSNSGEVKPSSGTIKRYEPPAGPGIRIDGFVYPKYQVSSNFDSLLAKLIVFNRNNDYVLALNKASRILSEFSIDGVDTNISFLLALLNHSKVKDNKITTTFIEDFGPELVSQAKQYVPKGSSSLDSNSESKNKKKLVENNISLSENEMLIAAPMQSTVVSLNVDIGQSIVAGQELAILEAMKMEHVLYSPCDGVVTQILTSAGITLMDGQAVCVMSSNNQQNLNKDFNQDVDLNLIRDDLKEVEQRRAFGLDENRQAAVEKRHKRGQQTARENIAQICDPGTFREYGEFAIAAQSQRRSNEDLIKNTSGDGIITGIAQVNGSLFDAELSRCALAVGDYMVLAGTQGQRHHRKLDRLLSVIEEWNIPLIFFAEGGGGRPGDTDRATHAGISNQTFTKFAQLSGKVPMVGVVSGRCFAGNAAFLGCCDVVIADESSNIGMAGPAMIEGGGLGVYPPEDIGPIDIQCQNGVVDVRVKNEHEACEVAKKYLSYFQGAIKEWLAPDQRQLRHVVPENRLRVYEVRNAIQAMADEDSVLELRKDFGLGIVTCFIRIEGKPFGVFANNTKHLGGAIDGDAADKASRFMQLCDAYNIPMISLCDCPGFMVGPEAEKTGLVRHVCRMYVTARSLTVPIFGVVLRKCYGLGAMAMLGGGTYDNFFTVSWPTGEFGPMGLEGAVKLGFRREFDALDSQEEKEVLYKKLLEEMYQQGKAIAVANTLEIDAVIDPVDTRKWVLSGLQSCKLDKPLSGQKRPCVDTW